MIEVLDNPHVASNNAQNLPRARVVKRGNECLCGTAKRPGDITCKHCWDEAPVGLRVLMRRRTTDRAEQREAAKRLLQFASERRTR